MDKTGDFCKENDDKMMVEGVIKSDNSIPNHYLPT